MEFQMAAIRDRSIDAYRSVQPFRAVGEAIRYFQDAIQNPQSGAMHQHPDDFDLYLVGTFDDNTGQLQPQQPVKIADGKNLTAKGE